MPMWYRKYYELQPLGHKHDLEKVHCEFMVSGLWFDFVKEMWDNETSTWRKSIMDVIETNNIGVLYIKNGDKVREIDPLHKVCKL